MIKNLLIHIGYHKTGTTWIQEELFHKHLNIFNPIGENNSSMTLVKPFVHTEDNQLLSPFEDVRRKIQNYVAQIYDPEYAGSRTPVISHERLSGYPHAGAFDAKIIAERLHSCFPNAKIWCVFREQQSMALSLYHHYLKNGGTDSVQTYLTRKYDGKRPGFSLQYLNYNLLITFYKNLFGSQNVLALPYEMFRKEPEIFLSHLGEFTGQPIPINQLDFNKKRNAHESYPLTRRFPSLNLFCRNTSLNSHSPFAKGFIPWWLKSDIRRKISRRLPSLNNNAYSPKTKRVVSEIIGHRYQESNRDLAQSIGLDLSKYGYFE